MNRVEHVTIVGGGTAGWLTAAVLDALLNEHRDGPPIAITLIESPDVPTIGVGEATVPGMRTLLRRIKVDEAEFLLRCNASLKYAVRFVDWNRDAAGNPISFLHPFDAPPAIQGKSPAYHYHRYGAGAEDEGLVRALLPSAEMVAARRAPRKPEEPQFDGVIRYSYHLDAALFGRFLRDVMLARGIRHIRDNVVEAARDERGFVTALRLQEGGELPVEFVVDCTGFRGLLIGDAMGEKFEALGDSLLCDSALAIQVPHVDPRRIEPCTTATALGAGWVWNLPLYSRVGTGYVFSSAFRSPEEARDEFVGHLKAQGYTVKDEPRLIRMRIGRRARPWVKNVVAIGLSGGFVEPLEATAIHTISASARALASNFPDRAVNPVLAERYNDEMGELFRNIVDFILLHYRTANRDEPFWRAAREDSRLTDSLAEKLEQWRCVLPSERDVPRTNLFASWSFIYVLYEKGWFDGVSFPLEGSLDKAGWDSFQRQMTEIRRTLRETLPGHYEFLKALRESKARALFGAPA
jgi:flavin-dependent dehydrogenase